MAIALKVQRKSERLMPLTGVIYVFVKTTIFPLNRGNEGASQTQEITSVPIFLV